MDTLKPIPCTSPNGLECANPEHDHRYVEGEAPLEQEHSPAGELLCNHDSQPIFWDERTQDYYHTDPTAVPCQQASTR